MPVGSKAMSSAAGRWARFEYALSKLEPGDRVMMRTAFEEISTPMNVRELEKAFQLFGLSASDRKLLVAALKQFDILMVRHK